MRYLLLLCSLLLLVGCEVNPLTEQKIVVTIEEGHPWREVLHKMPWKTLVYTDGTALKRIHLTSDENRTVITVRRDRPTIICAYPLSSLAPWGGYHEPGSKDLVVLTQDQGVFADLLVESWALNSQAFETIRVKALFEAIGDATLIDQHYVLLSLLDGTLQAQDIRYLDRLEVTLCDLPAGLWVSELITGPSFFALWDDEITLAVGGGIQRWINKEHALCLTLYADLVQRQWVAGISAAPRW
ncbi:MAG: hypothetical protein RBS49_03085 [Sphaerochaeta sp.]|nr:hypothetical protein [Sphaerochaeta sp.]